MIISHQQRLDAAASVEKTKYCVVSTALKVYNVYLVIFGGIEVENKLRKTVVDHS